MKHGLTHSRIYNIWVGIRRRCNDEKLNVYKYYGAKGISVCEEWSEFIPFYEWAMANGYSDELTIDRIDPLGNYTPSNCRWVTMKEQQNNRTNNHIIEYRGKTYTLQQLAEKYGINRFTFDARLRRGYTVKEAITHKLHKKHKSKKGVGE